MDLKNYVTIFDNVLPNETINKFIKVSKTLNLDLGKVDTGDVNPNIRKVNIYDFSAIDESLTNVHWYNFFSFVFLNCTKNYIQEKNINIYYAGQIQGLQFLRYSQGDHYEYHYDQAPGQQRSISCILFLNEDYEGGDIFFKNPDGQNEYTINKKKNRMIVWPSNFLFPHKVGPITKGERMSLVSWIT